LEFQNFYLLKNKILVMLICIVSPFIHPMGAIFLYIILFIKIVFAGSKKVKLNDLAILLTPLFVTLIWISRFYFFDQSIVYLKNQILQIDEVTNLIFISNQFNLSKLSLLNIFIYIFNSYGSILLITLLTFILIIYQIQQKIKIDNFYLFNFLFFFSFYLFTYFVDIFNLGPSIRILCWVIPFAILSNSIIKYPKILKGRWFNGVQILFFIVIILSSLNGIFSLYPSPIIKLTNPQLTKSDYFGMKLYFTNKDQNNTYYIDELPYRSFDMIFGFENTPKDIGAFYLIPERFGKIDNTYDNNNYLILDQRGVLLKQDIWPDVGRILYSDILEYKNANMNKYYSNKDLEIWRK